MSYSLALHNGDLSVSGTKVNTVSGREKLLQDLDTWFREQYRVDRFYPSYGSTLPDYIGTAATEMSLFLIKSEAIRIVNNYQQMQVAEFEKFPGKYTTDELIKEILDVQVTQNIETVRVAVTLLTISGATLTYQRGLSI